MYTSFLSQVTPSLTAECGVEDAPDRQLRVVVADHVRLARGCVRLRQLREVLDRVGRELLDVAILQVVARPCAEHREIARLLGRAGELVDLGQLVSGRLHHTVGDASASSVLGARCALERGDSLVNATKPLANRLVLGDSLV
jgi:hypothetical protein